MTLPTNTCTAPPGVQLAVGTHGVTATYCGDPNFSPSSATTPALITVTQASTSTTVSVAPATVAFGSEDGATFSVTVTPQFSGTPTGTVTTCSTGADHPVHGQPCAATGTCAAPGRPCRSAAPTH